MRNYSKLDNDYGKLKLNLNKSSFDAQNSLFDKQLKTTSTEGGLAKNLTSLGSDLTKDFKKSPFEYYAGRFLQGAGIGMSYADAKKKNHLIDKYSKSVIEPLIQQNMKIDNQINENKKREQEQMQMTTDLRSLIIDAEHNNGGVSFDDLPRDTKENYFRQFFDKQGMKLKAFDDKSNTAYFYDKEGKLSETDFGYKELAYQRDPDQAKFMLDQQKADTQQKSVENLIKTSSLDHHANKKANDVIIESIIKENSELEGKIKDKRQLIGKMKELERIYKETPEIFKNPIMINALNSEEPTVFANLIKNNPFTDKRVKDNASYALKLMNDLHLRRAGDTQSGGNSGGNSGGVRVTVNLLAMIKRSLANPSLTQKGALMALAQELKTYNNDLNNDIKKYEEGKGFIDYHKNALMKMQNGNTHYQPSNAVENNNTIKNIEVKSMKTGKTMFISEDKKEMAEQKGMVVVS